jgi:hypothetical protein
MSAGTGKYTFSKNILAFFALNKCTAKQAPTNLYRFFPFPTFPGPTFPDTS